MRTPSLQLVTDCRLRVDVPHTGGAPRCAAPRFPRRDTSAEIAPALAVTIRKVRFSLDWGAR
jgi:hypothetical protein